jgi:hypothetical protein
VGLVVEHRLVFEILPVNPGVAFANHLSIDVSIADLDMTYCAAVPRSWTSTQWNFEGGRRLAQHARHQRNRRKRLQSRHGESSFEWLSVGYSVRERDPDRRIRRWLLGFGSRRSVESGELPFGAYRQTP